MTYDEVRQTIMNDKYPWYGFINNYFDVEAIIKMPETGYDLPFLQLVVDRINLEARRNTIQRNISDLRNQLADRGIDGLRPDNKSLLQDTLKSFLSHSQQKKVEHDSRAQHMDKVFEAWRDTDPPGDGKFPLLVYAKLAC